ncbi:hypothetical protein BD560DRAFT_492670 [Blakeslea trispora]|nr:hypothetical protein BD560DRAFT_492670 [Blakeslea trispora]
MPKLRVNIMQFIMHKSSRTLNVMAIIVVTVYSSITNHSNISYCYNKRKSEITENYTGCISLGLNLSPIVTNRKIHFIHIAPPVASPRIDENWIKQFNQVVLKNSHPLLFFGFVTEASRGYLYELGFHLCYVTVRVKQH